MVKFQKTFARFGAMGGKPENLSLFKPNHLNVAVHVRNGDRLPNRTYAKNTWLNLNGDYYRAAVLAVVNAEAGSSSRRPVHVVVFGASVNKEAKESTHLLNAIGEPSQLPLDFAQMANLTSWQVRVDGEVTSLTLLQQMCSLLPAVVSRQLLL